MRPSIVCGFMTLAAVLAGCHGGLGVLGQRDYDRARLGPAAETIIAAAEAQGGLAAWQRMGPTKAMALVTSYDEKGEKYVNVQSQEIDALGGRISATAKTARGRWRASCTSGGRFSISKASALDAMSEQQLEGYLSMILHRFAGPFNLVVGRETAGQASQAWIEDRNLIRIPAESKGQSLVYYFDAPSGLLQMVTAGADAPGGKGTVTLYTYQMLPSGVSVPARIRIVQIGEHVLVGPKPVLEVEFTELGAE